MKKRSYGACARDGGRHVASAGAAVSLLAGLLCVGFCAAPLQAADLSVHGFGTLGVGYVDKPSDWAYTRSLNQRPTDSDLRADLDSVVGLQINYSLAANLELVGQASYARLREGARASDYLDLAFLAWRPDADWSMRLGRLNLDAYLLSEHRDVGFTYPFIRPPVEYYARMPSSLDGADIERVWVAGDVAWHAKAFGGRTTAGISEGRLKLRPLYGIMVSREANGLLLRFSALRARTRSGRLDPLLDALRDIQSLPVPVVAEQAAELEAALSTRDVHTKYLAAAAAYDRNNWLLQAEVNRAWARSSSAINFKSGYVSVGRRFGPLTAFVMESAALRDYKPGPAPDWQTPLAGIDPVLAQQAQALADGATIAAGKSAGHQFTTSAGLRWDVAPRLALKAQFDHVRTRRNGDGLWHSADGRANHSSIFAVAADFVF